MKFRSGTLVSLCVVLLALPCSAAKPKSKSKQSFKPVRPMEVPDSISEARRAEPVAPPPGSVSKIAPVTRSAAVMVIDARTGEILYEKNADAVRPPASTQKLLTALIVAERGFLDRPVTVERSDTLAEPSKLNIKAGETYSRMELLRALLVKSSNDVACTLARDAAGSIEGFAHLMNQKARELGAHRSNFVNPNGLPSPGQYSSARDLAIIAKAAYANSTIRSIVCLPRVVFRYSSGRVRQLENTNKLLNRLAYCNGMKTGYTDAAGKCLIASGARPGRDVIVVVLGNTSSGIWKDAGALLSWGLWM